MARRGFLDYVLGGAVGGLEGLAQKRAAEDEKKRMADAAAMDQARFLISSGFRIAPPETEDPAARSILPPLEMPSTTRSSLSPMTMPSTAPRPSAGASKALSAALNRDFKVDPTQPSFSRGLNVDPLAMDRSGSNMMEMFERAKQTRAAQDAIAASVTLPGGQKVRFNAPESDDAKLDRELRKYEAQQGVITARQKAEQDRANRGFFAILSRAKAIPEGVTYEEVQDIDLKPFFQEYSQGRSADAALQRAKLQGGYGSFFPGLTLEGQPNLFFGTRGGQITPTGVGATTSQAGGQIGTGLDYTADLQKISEFLPSLDPKTGKTVPAKRELSGPKLLTVQQGGLGGTLVGQVGTLGASLGGVDLGNEQIYNTTASGIATAYAIQEQRGRNVSDRDVKNRVEQVTLAPTEVGNLEVQALKANRLRQWITALSSNKIQQINPGETSVLPAIETIRSPSAPPSGGFPSYQEWAKSRKK